MLRGSAVAMFTNDRIDGTAPPRSVRGWLRAMRVARKQLDAMCITFRFDQRGNWIESTHAGMQIVLSFD